MSTVERKTLEIEASQINVGGGRTLLLDLLDHLQREGRAVVVWSGYPEMYQELTERYNSNSKIDIRYTTGWQTLQRYMQKRSSVLFFCSLPPFVPCAHSLTYVHNRYLVEEGAQGLSAKYRTWGHSIKHKLYTLWLSRCLKNTHVACQASDIQEGLQRRYGCTAEVMPFYRIPEMGHDEVAKAYDFCYVALGAEHKNHRTLLKALELLDADTPLSIALTVPTDDTPELYAEVEACKSRLRNVRLDNLGRSSRSEVLRLYQQSRCLVFPSLLETLGLPLIEAHEMGLKVLASDLPYVYNSIENVATFDPYKAEDIADKMRRALRGEYDRLEQKCLVKNRITDIIDILDGK